MNRRDAVLKRRATVRKAIELLGEDPTNDVVFRVVECGLHSGRPVDGNGVLPRED